MPARTRGGAPLKGLSAVRGSGVHANDPHVHQFQLALLELERTRRTHERQAAQRRVRELDERLAEIDALVRTHRDAASARADSAVTDERTTAVTHKRRTLKY